MVMLLFVQARGRKFVMSEAERRVFVVMMLFVGDFRTSERRRRRRGTIGDVRERCVGERSGEGSGRGLCCYSCLRLLVLQCGVKIGCRRREEGESKLWVM